ncbi:MAG: hypothetical protein ACLRMN_06875 [Mediterraneibacter gnavus]
MQCTLCINRTPWSKRNRSDRYFGILLCLNQPVQYLIEMAIAVGVAFAVSFILYKDKKEDIKEQAEAVIPAEELPVSTGRGCHRRDSGKSRFRKSCFDS